MLIIPPAANQGPKANAVEKTIDERNLPKTHQIIARNAAKIIL